MDATVCGAIRARKLLIFEYAGLMRVVEPHLHGVNTAGRDALTAAAASPLSDAAAGGRAATTDAPPDD